MECKKIGSPTSSSWILNENYIVNGSKRFDSSIHEYGKRASSGLMIGYKISMSHRAILREVNKFQSIHFSGLRPLAMKKIDSKISRGNQKLRRRMVLAEKLHFNPFVGRASIGIRMLPLFTTMDRWTIQIIHREEYPDT